MRDPEAGIAERCPLGIDGVWGPPLRMSSLRQFGRNSSTLVAVAHTSELHLSVSRTRRAITRNLRAESRMTMAWMRLDSVVQRIVKRSNIRPLRRQAFANSPRGARKPAANRFPSEPRRAAGAPDRTSTARPRGRNRPLAGQVGLLAARIVSASRCCSRAASWGSSNASPARAASTVAAPWSWARGSPLTPQGPPGW